MYETPRAIRAVLGALRFSDAAPEQLRLLTAAEWEKALAFCDRQQLTLPLLIRCATFLPDTVRVRIEGNLAHNSLRFENIKTSYWEVAGALREADVEFVVLKGFSHYPEFAGDPRFRVQYDMDLFCPHKEALVRARDAVRKLKYEPLEGFENFPIDHLPSMIRKTGWEWRGDHYDPEIPPSIELHFRLWDRATERFGPEGLEHFWERRISCELEGVTFLALHPVDKLGYASLHLLRHLLRGDLRLSHAYEIAWCLEQKQADDSFWETWSEYHGASLRSLEAICFALAELWFGCGLNVRAQREIDQLPANVRRWLQLHGRAPIASKFAPNKQELWLHLSLVDALFDKLSVVRRRLVPGRLPGQVDAVTLPDAQMTWRRRVLKRVRYARYLSSRVWHHARLLAPTLWHGLRWWSTGKKIGKAFFIFLAASALYDFGLFIFFLLYNLYLLDRGFKEDFLGLVASAVTAGSVVGTIPAAMLANRFGLKRAIQLCFLSIAVISASRVLVIEPAALLGLAFLGGMAGSIWAVSISPAIAQLTGEENRPFGFSFIFSTGIAIGIAGGIAGGSLGGWLMKLHLASGKLHAAQGSLLIGCGIAALASWPASHLRFETAPPRETRLFPRNPFVFRYLAALAVWSLATGAFNPFFNAYFARVIHMPVQRIGFVFSGAQFAQVIAMLLAPAVFRKFGLVTGIVYTQVLTALTLAGLATGPGASMAALGFMGYSAFQWMSEPGMYSLLMSQVSAPERTGASALNFLVVFSANAIAAALAGAALSKYGYSPVLGTAAVVALLAAVLFRTLPDRITSKT
jgi:MFS family permease